MIEILTIKLREHLYRFEETGGPNRVHVYLICGTEKALMIDGLWLAEGLLEKADHILKTEYGDRYTQESRDKFLEMLITHGHEDHAGKGTEEFLQAGCRVFLSEKDWFLLEERYHCDREKFTFLKKEMWMDLGHLKVQVREMTGHTPGSLIAWIPDWNTLFTSDAIGAGVLWMQLPECSPLSRYEQEVEKLLTFLEKEKERCGEEVRIYPGHAQQIRTKSGKADVCLSYTYVREVQELTGMIRKNARVGERKQIDYPGLENAEVRSIGKKLLYDYCYDAKKAIW